MALRNILVAYNGSDSSNAALALALHMQSKYDAHLTGLLTVPSRIDLTDQPWLPATIRKTILDLDKKNVQEIADKFQATCSGKAIEGQTHWIAQRGASDGTVSNYAQMFDLTIVGRGDSVAAEKRFDLHPDRIALKSGRPILVVPQSWKRAKFAEHALLAWDGKRSAARALYDAMQILESKQLVTVLSAVTRNVETPLEGIDVETVLDRHGIKTKRVFADLKGRAISQVLLEECETRDAGLLVMGAYEHSKFREDIWGGVTNDVLEKSTIPVLLSH